MSKVRINDLARELEVKSKSILDALTAVGVTEKKTHSSSIEEDEAEKVRGYFSRGGRSSATRPAPVDTRPKFDLSHVSKPGDALKAILERKQAETAARMAPPPRPAVTVAPPANRPPVVTTRPVVAAPAAQAPVAQAPAVQAPVAQAPAAQAPVVHAAAQAPAAAPSAPVAAAPPAPPAPRRIVPIPRPATPNFVTPPPAIASRPVTGPVVARPPAGSAPAPVVAAPPAEAVVVKPAAAPARQRQFPLRRPLRLPRRGSCCRSCSAGGRACGCSGSGTSCGSSGASGCPGSSGSSRGHAADRTATDLQRAASSSGWTADAHLPASAPGLPGQPEYREPRDRVRRWLPAHAGPCTPPGPSRAARAEVPEVPASLRGRALVAARDALGLAIGRSCSGRADAGSGRGTGTRPSGTSRPAWPRRPALREEQGSRAQGLRVPRFGGPQIPQGDVPITKTITVTEGISVKDLAEKLDVRGKDLIATLLMRGVMVTVNQSLDGELVKDVCPPVRRRRHGHLRRRAAGERGHRRPAGRHLQPRRGRARAGRHHHGPRRSR